MGRPTRFIDTDIDSFFSRPGIKVLDLCSCSGLVAEGILRHKNVHVLGVDINRPSYYPGTFLLSDATQLPQSFISKFNFVWASPPCQLYSRATKYAQKTGKVYPNLIPAIRKILMESNIHSVMENIPESGIRPDFMLCGSMFDLPQQRHRHFECINWYPTYQKLYCNHAPNKGNNHIIAGGFTGTIHDAARSMGCISTRLRAEIKEGIPPAYSEFIFNTWLTNSQDFNNCKAF